MSFMSAYKHLDMICRDMNGRGVSGYIDDMEANQRGSYTVQGWDSDYRQLKHYRWVRNQIAHEMNAEEDNMCTLEDTQWLENFYRRIMNCSDPLAHYAAMQKATAAKPTAVPPKQSRYTSVREPQRLGKNRSRQYIGWFIFGLLAVIACIVWRIAAGV